MVARGNYFTLYNIPARRKHQKLVIYFYERCYLICLKILLDFLMKTIRVSHFFENRKKTNQIQTLLRYNESNKMDRKLKWQRNTDILKAIKVWIGPCGTIDGEIHQMKQLIRVNNHLAIELLPGTDESAPALRLFPPNDPEQSFIVFLSEIHLLRDALANAGAQLLELEKEARMRRKQQAATLDRL